MKLLKKNQFTLMEVVFALAVVALALAAILPLMTVGLRATKDSIADNYVADTAEQFLHYMAAKCKKDDTTWNDYIGTSDATGKITSEKPEKDNDGNDIIEDSIASLQEIGNTNLFSMPSFSNIFAIKQGSDTVTDFTGVIRVWKSPVKSQIYSGSGWNEQTDSSYDHSAGLNIEISWPAEIPYAQREKKYFYLEIFKPN